MSNVMTVMAASMQYDSSSSEDEEAIARLKDAAVDSTLFASSTSEQNGNTKEKAVSHLPSLRPDKARDVDENDDRLHVPHTTPGFRKHVAKKLTVALDSDIDTSMKCFCSSETSREETRGIRLFTSSKEFLTSVKLEEETTNQRQRIKRPHSPSTDDSSEDEKLAEAAVSHDFIINQSYLPSLANQKPPDVTITASADDISVQDVETKKYTKTENIANNIEHNLSDKSHKKKKKKKKSHKGLDDT